MNACHSVSTLREMLHEAGRRLESSPPALAGRIEELERAIAAGGAVSASVEQEIVSLCVFAELEGVPPRSSLPPSEW